MKRISQGVLVLLCVVLTYAYYTNNTITNPEDYHKYLTNKFLKEAIAESEMQLKFWDEKLSLSANNHVYQKKIAALLYKKFKLTGNPKYLHQSDSLYQLVHLRFPLDVSVLQALASNSISRHAFKEAEYYITKAYTTGEKKFASSLLMADIYLERGNFPKAALKLKDISTKQHFDYFIRLVKWQDQQGELNKAVKSMERALAMAKSSNNKSLINWSLSNLADMYGHQGKINKSYQTYLEALNYNPTDFHSLKGIAWIAFAHEKNTKEAKRILSHLKEIHPIPDYELILSEIADYEGNEALKESHLKQFVESASQRIYGNMYRPYLCLIYSENLEQIALAKKLVEMEIEERPHPMSYSLLAWVANANGEHKKALDIIEKHVVDQTEEPDALYRIGMIYHDNQQFDVAYTYLSAAQEAEFELGPIVSKEIDHYIAQR